MAKDVPSLIPRAQKYAAAAFAFSERFPFPSKGSHAAKQFYEASSSATSNYCAAKRGRTTAEFISKLGTVVEEIDEAVGWLEHMSDIASPSTPTCFPKPSSCAGFGAHLSAPSGAMKKRDSSA